MQKLKRSGFTAFILIGLLTGSGVAWAADEEVGATPETIEFGQAADTLFRFGYDLINRMFIFDLSALDGDTAYDCPLAEDAAAATDGETSEVDCGRTVEVSGPQGQVNHGTFLSLINSLWEGPGRGCVIRHLAQSDLGKGDQQVKANDEAGPDNEVEPVGAGEIDLTSVETTCRHGNQGSDVEVDDGSAEVESADNKSGDNKSLGKPEGVGKPASPGNSGSAPGHNK